MDPAHTVVEVHYALLADLAEPSLQSDYARVLAGEECERLARLHNPGRRLEYLATRALARSVIGAALDRAPESLRFSAGAHGKPALLGADSGALAFNLSNTAGLIACAFTRPAGGDSALDLELGVDVEAHARRARLVPIARRFFAAPEVSALLALPEADQRQRFFTYWTLKEAYIKARGMGLALPLRSFFFLLDQPAPRVDFVAGFDDRPGRWRFAQFQPTADHLGAVALNSARPLALVLRRVVPLRSARHPHP